MKLLVVEDEPKLGTAIKRGLEQEGFAVELVGDAEDGLNYARGDIYDLIILDRMLPDGQDGLDICKILREEGDTTPILMLTAIGEVNDRVDGLDTGADDYLVKPFEFDELVARVRALLRRPAEAIGPVVNVGDLSINTATKTVKRGGNIINLSKREYALLEYLSHNQGNTVSKDQLIQHVWDFDADILPNTVEVFIKSLRTKIDGQGESYIETVRGFGYRLRSA